MRLDASSMNTRLAYRGPGLLDPKAGVVNLEELQNLYNDYKDYFVDGHAVWVMSSENDYIFKQALVGVEFPPFLKKDYLTSIDIPPGVRLSNGEEIVKCIEDQLIGCSIGYCDAFCPVPRGYTDKDIIQVKAGVTPLPINSPAGIILPKDTVEAFDQWQVSIVKNDDRYPNGTYTYVGNVKGATGDQGLQGEAGNPGEFKIDAECVSITCLTTVYCVKNSGFTALVKGNGTTIPDMLYFKLTDYQPENTCALSDWSSGTEFNTGRDGQDGRTTDQIFSTRDPLLIQAPTNTAIAVGGDGMPVLPYTTPNGTLWTDAPTPVGPGQRMYMLKSYQYSSLDTYISWAVPPTPIDGEEGKDSGIWTIWHDKLDGRPADPPFNALSEDQEWMNKESTLREHLLNIGNGWYDDADDKNMDGNKDDPGKPVWMATSYLVKDTQTWKKWTVTKIEGERPDYQINVYKWAATRPAIPTVSLVTYGDYANSIFNPTIDGWGDSPDSTTPADGDLLWMSVTNISYTGADQESTGWAVPIQVEGSEGPKGDGSALWVIWTDVFSFSAPRKLEGEYDAYTTDAEVIDWVNYGVAGNWYSDADEDKATIYSATAIFNSGAGTWSDWKISKTKGEDGDNFKIDIYESVEPWEWTVAEGIDCSTLPPGYTFLNTSASLLYFLDTPGDCDTSIGWSEGVSFGQGVPGDTTYFYYTRSTDSPPALPTIKPASPGESPIEGWEDGVPLGSDPVWTSTIIYSEPTFGEWQDAIKIEGEDGAEGAGIWTIFSKSKSPFDISEVPLPIDNPGTWNGGVSYFEDWLDDVGVDNGNLGGESPKWMAITRYDVNKPGWLPWALAMVKGEEPGYKVNAYARYRTDNTNQKIPPPPEKQIDYGNGFGSTEEIDGVAWKDTPYNKMDDTSVDVRYRLFSSSLEVTADNIAHSWSTPVQVDGGAESEGMRAGVWTIWFEQISEKDILKNQLPTLDSPNTMITATSDGIGTINLVGFTNGYGKWIDDAIQSPETRFVTYMAKTNYLGGQWLNWVITKVKGETGPQGPDGEGTPGAPGGTIIMFSQDSSTTVSTPRNPTSSELIDPGLTAKDLEGGGWLESIISGDAIWLAVMTFGYDSAAKVSKWSVWRLSRIKGSDGADVPVGASIYTGSFGTSVTPGWSLTSGNMDLIPSGAASGYLTPGKCLMTYGGNEASLLSNISDDIRTGTSTLTPITTRATWYPNSVFTVVNLGALEVITDIAGDSGDYIYGNGSIGEINVTTRTSKVIGDDVYSGIEAVLGNIKTAAHNPVKPSGVQYTNITIGGESGSGLGAGKGSFMTLVAQFIPASPVTGIVNIEVLDNGDILGFFGYAGTEYKAYRILFSEDYSFYISKYINRTS